MSNQRHNGEYQSADPSYRKQMIVWLTVTTIAGAVGLLALNFWLQRLGSTLGPNDPYSLQLWLERLLAGICLLLAGGAAGFSFWMYRLAKATRAERRWPPSTMRLSQDVRIRYLTSADALVSQLQVGALLLAMLAAALTVWAVWLMSFVG